jgi:hypothetical protein
MSGVQPMSDAAASHVAAIDAAPNALRESGPPDGEIKTRAGAAPRPGASIRAAVGGILGALPDELLSATAAFLTPEDRTAARQVCRSWKGGVPQWTLGGLSASALTPDQFRWASKFGAVTTLRLARRAALTGDLASLRTAFECSGRLPWDNECTRAAVAGGHGVLLNWAVRGGQDRGWAAAGPLRGFHPDHVAACAIASNNVKILVWAFAMLRAKIQTNYVVVQLGRTANPVTIQVYIYLMVTSREGVIARMLENRRSDFHVDDMMPDRTTDVQKILKKSLINLIYTIIACENTGRDQPYPAMRPALEWLIRTYPPQPAACEELCPLLAETGELKLLQEVDATGVEYDREAVTHTAVHHNRAAVLDWLHESGRGVFTPAAFEAAFESENPLEVMQQLRRIGCPWDETILDDALFADLMDIATWLAANGCPQSEYAALQFARRAAAE